MHACPGVASAYGPWSLRWGGLTKMTIGLEHNIWYWTTAASQAAGPHLVILGSLPHRDMNRQPRGKATPSLQALGLFST